MSSDYTSKLRKIIGLPTRFFRIVLYFCFRFDKWHINPLYDRKYAREIIKYLNKRTKAGSETIVEIGCGLGDMLRNLNYRSKVGLDLDENALKAARFLSKLQFDKSVQYEWFKFPESPLTGQYNIIIMVNWIHHVPPTVLKDKISEYCKSNLTEGGEIIIDTVQDKSYKINHSISFLSEGLNCRVNKIADDICEREVFAMTKL